MLRWDAPAPYEVVFSTRKGGVSEGPYESLNLGRMTGDDVERVDENRRRLCTEIGADVKALALNRQVQSTIVHRARAGARGEPGDGLWTDERDLPVLALTADCLPIALARTNAGRPAVAVLHAGWRGLLGGIVGLGTEAIGGHLAACVGPGIGPCCYEVGKEVLQAFEDIVGAADGRMLDLRAVIAHNLAAAGVANVQHLEHCTSCRPELYFSHRRDNGVTGRQAGLVVLDA